jgi:predicted O-methyltransferase YrrM
MKEMRQFWEQITTIVASTDFPQHGEERCRYYWDNQVFPIGDAAILRVMIAYAKPKRIIEIGSGFSSGCMLDTLDEMEMKETRLTFIEPYPDRMMKLLRSGDYDRITLIEAPVQSVDLSAFDQLDQNDILFIDSSHVMKACSDVNFELFEILPRLKPGVIIHFHDIHYPFELAEKWMFESRYSWNEVYGLRAFLMYNKNFKILFFNDLFAIENWDLIASTCAKILGNPGASLWLAKLDD